MERSVFGTWHGRTPSRVRSSRTDSPFGEEKLYVQ
jgi:hypothetical protein